MDSRLKVASFIIATLVLATALSSVFRQVPVVPLDYLWEEEEDQTPYEERQLLFVDISSLSHKLMFSVYNGDGVSYLKSSVLTHYDMGAWSSTPSVEQRYRNFDLRTELPSCATVMEDSLSISPAFNFTSYLPVPKITKKAIFDASDDIFYSEEYQTFRTENPLDSLYSVRFDRYIIPEKALNESEIPDILDKYLQLPEGSGDRIREFAEFVSSASESPYQKAKDIERFLKTTFTYTGGYEPAPFGEDPIEWFLFGSREGICTHFNSAFVLMARSLGIPARLCVGYLIDPGSFVQHVYLDQAHVFAEIKLEGMGWLTFDATGLAEETQFTPTDPNPVVGTVSGTVFYDRDANRRRDPGEPQIEGQTVVVQNRTSGDVVSVITDQAGMYFLSGLEEGEYSISVLPDDDLIIPNFYHQIFYLTSDRWWTFDIGLAYPSDFPEINETRTLIDFIDPILYRNSTFMVRGIVNCISERSHSGPEIFVYLMMENGAGPPWTCGMGIPFNIRTAEFSIGCKLPSDIPTGNYTLVTRCAGDEYWNGSSCEQEVRVMDRSTFLYNGSMHLVSGIPCRLSFALVESSTLEPVIGQAVTLRCEGDRVEMTDEAGEVNIDLIPSVGNHSVELDFAGNYLLDGNLTRFDLEAFQPGVSLERLDLVRGEENRILGRVLAGDIPLGGEELEMELSLDLEENAISDGNGYFDIDIDLPEDLDLEEIDCLFTLPGFDVLDHMHLRVTARPSIELSVSGNVVSARLIDDIGSPISGDNISFYATGVDVDLTTDQDGRTWLDMGSVEELNLTVEYDGSDIYQPVSVTMIYAPSSDLEWLLVGAIAIIATVAGGTLVIRRRRSSGPTEVAPIDEVSVEVEGTPFIPYDLTFRGIAQYMPLVWEAGKPLDLVLQNRDEAIHVVLDGIEIQGSWDRDGTLFILVMEKGDHLIQLEGANGIHEGTIRAVEYREEVVDLFNSAILRWGSHFPSLSKNMTPREGQTLVKDRYEGQGEQLEIMISTFELANYSNHPISRKEYERMYLATAELI
jgi:transglutaminase-like putative cysteine protease